MSRPGPETELPDESLLLRRQAPAWLLSLALHMAALLVGGLLVGGTQLPTSDGEPLRASSIVLAKLSPTSEAQYFTEEDAQAAEKDQSSVTSASTAAAAEPTDEPPAAAIELPMLTGPATNADSLVIRPTPSAGRGPPRIGMSEADVAAILAEEAARARPAAPSGPTTKLSLFGSAQAEGRSFVFLIDRSQSMGGEGLGAIAAAAKELSASIDRLSSEHKFQVIAYNQKPFSLSLRELLAATDDNKRKLIDFVANLSAFGATEHEIGLFAALRLKPDVIFILTDGGEPGLNAVQLRSIRDAAARRTAIHALHFGAGPAPVEKHFLQSLAEQCGGSYVYIDMTSK